MNLSTPSVPDRRRRKPPAGRRRGVYIRPPAERGKLDTIAGLTLWLTLTHGFAGAGIGFVLGQLTV